MRMTKADYYNILDILDGKFAYRQVRRRLIRSGYLDKELQLTELGNKGIIFWAPRSEWKPRYLGPHAISPLNQQSGNNKRMSRLMMVSAIAAISSIK